MTTSAGSNGSGRSPARHRGWRYLPARNRHCPQRIPQRLRLVRIAARIGAAVSACFGVLPFFVDSMSLPVGVLNLAAAGVFASIPTLYRFGELLAPLTFVVTSYTTIFVVCSAVGTASGLQFYFLAAASILVLILGVERIALAAVLTGVGAALMIVLELTVSADTGRQPGWVLTVSSVSVIVSACLMVVATIWYVLREITRAEAAAEAEYRRSESLLTNILPASIAERLKDPAVDVIADRYDDASILFADIANFTARASDIPPDELVGFLDGLYTELDRMVDQRGLEKIKTSGDSYMVVSGVPDPRPDHLEELARLALDIVDAVTGLADPLGRPISLRIGLAAGPVVAGVVGVRRFSYDVWGDTVNLAARMQSTGREGCVQVPRDVHDRLRHDFIFEERGDVDVKGKGVMHTWYLVGERPRGNGHRMPGPLSATRTALN